MSMPKMDPRYNRDRVYQYSDYKVISASFAKQKRRAWYESLLPFKRNRSKPPHAIRLLPYKLTLAVGVILVMGSLAVMAALNVDNTRLDYDAQEHSANIQTLDQSILEAEGANIEAEGVVFSGGVVPSSEVIYPETIKKITLTNIPSASGKTLVSELYPLSKELIRLEQ